MKSLMFFQLFILGCHAPIQSLYFKQQLGFSDAETGLLLGFSVICSVIAPFIGAHLADRVVSSRRLLQLGNLGAAFLCLFFSFNYGELVWINLVAFYLLIFLQGPAIGLIHALVFEHLDEPNSQFGGVRLWGTIGWIIAGFSLGAVTTVIEAVFPGQIDSSTLLPWSFRIAAVGNIVTVFLSGRFPSARKDGHFPGHEEKTKFQLISPQTRWIFRNKALGGMVLFYLLVSLLDRFYTFGAAPYLSRLGIPQEWILPVLTLGQVLEIPALFILGRLTKRFAAKPLLLVGISLQIMRFAIFAWLPHTVLIFIGLSMNGVIFALYFTLATILMDKLAGPQNRAALHQINTISQVGIAGFVGNNLAGVISEHFSGLGSITGYWIIPTILSAVVALAFVLRYGRSAELEKSPVNN